MARLAPRDDFTSQISDKLGSPITTGSFGEVYRCIVESSTIGKTEVAVKVFKFDSKRTMEKLTKAILRELQVWLRLKHRTIVPLLGTARVESPLPIPLELNWSRASQKASLIVRRCLSCRQFAPYPYLVHSENVIHGDLHPRNILIDGSGNPCLTDFGLATVAEDPELQWTTTTAGRNLDPRWRAPEVIGIESDPVRPTFKSDIYSLGGVMFFILSGDIPWKKKKYSNQIVIELSRGATPTRPRNILFFNWDLIQTCWSWIPAHRPDATKILHLIQALAKSSQKIIDNSTSQQSQHLDLYQQTSSNRIRHMNAYSSTNLLQPGPEDPYHNPNNPHGAKKQATADLWTSITPTMRRDFSSPYSPSIQSPNSHALHHNLWRQSQDSAISHDSPIATPHIRLTAKVLASYLHHDTSRSYTQQTHLLTCRWLNEDNVSCEFRGPLDAMKGHLTTMHLSGPQDEQTRCHWIGCDYCKRVQPDAHTMRRDSMWRHIYEVHLLIRYRKKVHRQDT